MQCQVFFELKYLVDESNGLYVCCWIGRWRIGSLQLQTLRSGLFPTEVLKAFWSCPEELQAALSLNPVSRRIVEQFWGVVFRDSVLDGGEVWRPRKLFRGRKQNIVGWVALVDACHSSLFFLSFSLHYSGLNFCLLFLFFELFEFCFSLFFFLFLFV